MKKSIYILAILLLFTQCMKEETIKPKERIGVYDAGIGVTAPTIIKYPDFELHVESFSDYNPRGIASAFSRAQLKLVTSIFEKEFSLLTGPGPHGNPKDILNHQIKEITINNILFRITFETFNWDADKSTDEVLIVDKGRFLVEKVE